MPSSSARATSSSLGLAPLVAGLAVAGRREERGPDALGGAGAEEIGVGRGRRAHEDEIDRAVGQVVDVGDGLDAEHLLTLQVGAEHAAGVPAGEQVVERHEPELARVARGAGDQHAAWLEQRPELLVGRWLPSRPGLIVGPRCRVDLDERVDGDRHGRPAATISGLMSTLTTSGRSIGEPAEPDEHGDEFGSIDRRLAAELAEQRLRRQVVDHARRAAVVERSGAEHDVGHRLGEDRRRRPSITVAPNCGSRTRPAISSRLPLTIGATSTVTSPSSVARGSEQFGRRSFDRGPVAETQPDEAALGLVGDRVAVQLGDDRIADLVRPRPPASAGLVTNSSAASGTPYVASNSFDARSDSVVDVPAVAAALVVAVSGSGCSGPRSSSGRSCSPSAKPYRRRRPSDGISRCRQSTVTSPVTSGCVSARTGISAAAKNSMMCSRRRSSAAGASGFSSSSPSRNGASEK